MIRGLYTSASGMNAQLTAQEVISNNLANVDTTGYKKDVIVDRAFNALLINRIGDKTDRGMEVTLGNLGTGVNVDDVFVDFSAGPLKATENKLDVAIAGEGFFVIQTPQGELYTRDGSFTLNAGGEMVTKDGFTVMGQNGVVNIGNAVNLTINQDGSVVADGVVVNTLRVVNVQDPQTLHKVGNNLFAVEAGGAVEDSNNFSLAQGFLEASNVNVVNEMVRMMSGLRLYEANQRAIRSQDETLSRLINEVAKV